MYQNAHFHPQPHPYFSASLAMGCWIYKQELDTKAETPTDWIQPCAYSPKVKKGVSNNENA